MYLSTSSSDDLRGASRLDRFTIALLGTCLAILAVAEGVTVVGFDRTSKVQRREISQREMLLTVRDTESSRRAHVVVLGNSLLLEAVDVPLLVEKLEPNFTPTPYFVLATVYYDWFFGLKRLFAEGMRPRYVLLGLSPNQFASGRTRGDYSARYLFQGADLLEVARRTRMDATRTSGFLLSHVSQYYSTRGVTRGFVLSRALPSVWELLHSRMGGTREPEIDETALRQLGAERLTALDQLCRANGSRFILVIPPSYQKGAETIAAIGTDRHVTVMVPVGNDAFDASHYQSDAFHLNAKGARIFTARLAVDLVGELSRH
jgi:hypothetical protein